MVQLIAVGAFTLGIAGIVAWVMGGQGMHGRQKITAGRDSAVGGRDAVVGSTVSQSAADTNHTNRSQHSESRQSLGYQKIRAGRDAVVGGRDAVVQSKIGGAHNADRKDDQQSHR
ncbi:hypothetical protein [Rhodopila globiformis]|uniref:hypothetical protein n=1 Tax=Rhodopila globiformis TaxID=1071 RepID=UPI001304EA3B|nr:hypothetical protein [Rhodopila globiformis]